ncbi:MAG: cobalamin-dependent protein [gamma proteobacterium symbiont of Bathyaustriella thionipta]|nr:cobalamin-dependent protein [gamma proteobacterium symbiont of Bathyaustriella thionipta]MCU7951707.1 cobalamin-dependent protein [gamma proteobacterium symbiont of Bathyaustriella thionipta]MCU7953507.1 cobalamin-dependent protein [gamma proteobacterium symbiont of Bathyaustriella thionipta]MCU7958308.1 cobalamin-dependent protein [gamma proteobacterium symbiont of Bathyaustriella thionipta]MCU7966174.1 cobalamin-dependent protein [gamma proteobacterium symbiont of Bathyaustriella thionipta
MTNFEHYSRELEQAILSTDQIRAELILVDLGDISTQDFVEKIIVPAMDHIGDGWEDGSVAISQVYMGAKICESLILQTSDPEAKFRQPQLHFAITVLEDFHLLGKSIVYSVLRGLGYKVDDFGRTTVEQLVDMVEQESVDILLISTLMLRSALKIKELRNRLVERGLDIKLVVGGAPFRFDTQLWEEVGADATAVGTSELIPVIERLTGEAD